ATRPRHDRRSSATAGDHSCRDVTASIRTFGWRRRILISSAAVYPDPPRIATLVIRSGQWSEVRSQKSEVSLAGGPTARPVSYATMHTIGSAAAAIRRGEITSVDLLDQCFERIDRLEPHEALVEQIDQCFERIDRLEPHVRAWVLVDRD